MRILLTFSFLCSVIIPQAKAQRDAPKRIAYCVFDHVSGGMNLSITSYDDGSIYAVTKMEDGSEVKKVRVTGGFTQSSVFQVPMGLFVKTPSDTVYTIAIWVWKNRVASGEVTTPPVLPGLENHVEAITCPIVNG